MDKLSLMHNLNLDEGSTIHLVISGIQSRSLRETAASLNSSSIDRFLDSMHQITSVSADTDKKLPAEAKSFKSKEVASKSSSREGPANQKGKGDQFCANDASMCEQIAS